MSPLNAVPGRGHVALTVSDLRRSVVRYRRLLDDLDIPHGSIVAATYGSGLSFEDPDGIALGFFAPADRGTR
jgi:glyoxylase I family protein